MIIKWSLFQITNEDQSADTEALRNLNKWVSAMMVPNDDASNGFADNDDDNDNEDLSWQEAGWRHEGEDSDDEHWRRLHSCDQALDELHPHQQS